MFDEPEAVGVSQVAAIFVPHGISSESPVKAGEAARDKDVASPYSADGGEVSREVVGRSSKMCKRAVRGSRYSIGTLGVDEGGARRPRDPVSSVRAHTEDAVVRRDISQMEGGV